MLATNSAKDFDAPKIASVADRKWHRDSAADRMKAVLLCQLLWRRRIAGREVLDNEAIYRSIMLSG